MDCDASAGQTAHNLERCIKGLGRRPNHIGNKGFLPLGFSGSAANLASITCHAGRAFYRLPCCNAEYIRGKSIQLRWVCLGGFSEKTSRGQGPLFLCIYAEAAVLLNCATPAYIKVMNYVLALLLPPFPSC